MSGEKGVIVAPKTSVEYVMRMESRAIVTRGLLLCRRRHTLAHVLHTRAPH